MSLFTNPTPQILDNNGDPSPGAKLFFFETGTSTLKTIYSDSNFTTAQSNPVVCDANGRLTSEVFLDGIYRVVGQTSEGVNIDGWDKDPVGDVESGQWSAWSNDATYNIPDVVEGSDDEFYQSLTNSNQGNDPVGDAVNWVKLKLVTDAEYTSLVEGSSTYGGASSVGTDSYAATLPVSPGAYAAGQRYQFLTDVANTGACTIDFNSVGVANIKLANGSDPYTNAIKATSIVDVEYDGTNFILLNPFLDFSAVTGQVTATHTELNYIVGVTSSIQSQIDATIKTTGAQSKAGVLTLTDNPIISNSSSFLTIKDSDNTSGETALRSYVAGSDSADATLWLMGRPAATTDLRLTNAITDADIDLGTQGTGIAKVNGNEIWDTGDVTIKTADESVTTSTVLQDDNDFINFSLDADSWYVFEGILKVNVSPVGNGFKMKLVFTNTEQIQNSSAMYDIESAGNVNEQQNDAIGGTLNVADVADSSMRFSSRFKTNASTGGTLKIQWAQVIATGTTKMFAGSYLALRKLA